MTRKISATEWWRVVVAHAALTDAYGSNGVDLPNPSQIDYGSLAAVFDDVPPVRVTVAQSPSAANPAPTPQGPVASLRDTEEQRKGPVSRETNYQEANYRPSTRRRGTNAVRHHVGKRTAESDSEHVRGHILGILHE